MNNDHASKVEGAIENAEDGLENLLHIFHRMVPTNIFKAAVEGQLLGLIFFSLLFGYFISKLPADAKDLQIRFWESFNSVILGITKFIISFKPYGVFALVTPTIMQVGLDTLSVMGSFALTVVAGLAFHALIIILPLLLRIFGGISLLNIIER